MRMKNNQGSGQRKTWRRKVKNNCKAACIIWRKTDIMLPIDWIRLGETHRLQHTLHQRRGLLHRGDELIFGLLNFKARGLSFLWSGGPIAGLAGVQGEAGRL